MNSSLHRYSRPRSIPYANPMPSSLIPPHIPYLPVAVTTCNVSSYRYVTTCQYHSGYLVSNLLLQYRTVVVTPQYKTSYGVKKLYTIGIDITIRCNYLNCNGIEVSMYRYIPIRPLENTQCRERRVPSAGVPLSPIPHTHIHYESKKYLPSTH